MKIFVTFFLAVLLSSLNAQIKPAPSSANVEMAKPIDTFQVVIADSRTSLAELTKWLDEWEAQLNAEAAAPTTRTSNLNLSKSNINRQMGVPVNCSRSNIKTLSKKMDDLEKSDASKRSAALADVNKALAELNSCITALYDSIANRGEAYSAKAAELKTKHETVKNTIGNIR